MPVPSISVRFPADTAAKILDVTLDEIASNNRLVDHIKRKRSVRPSEKAMWLADISLGQEHRKLMAGALYDALNEAEFDLVSRVKEKAEELL